MPDASWMAARKFGLCFHYLDSPASYSGAAPTTADNWNRRIDGFDVSRLVETVTQCGVGYVLWTLGQNTGHYGAPNATYEAPKLPTPPVPSLFEWQKAASR